MIKNWKLFLESSQENFDPAEFRKMTEELKNSLIKVFSRFFIGEHLLRSTGENVDSYLEQGVNIIIEQILVCFEESLRTKIFDEETAEFLMDSLYESAKVAKSIMIKRSFKEGISKLVDSFSDMIIEHKKKQDLEGEEWKQPKTVEYEDLSKGEIQKLIDDTFDNRDKNPNWKKEIEFYTSLPNFLKESVGSPEGKLELKKACEEIATLLVNFCMSILKVK